jgi:hypothetical protein
MGHAARSCKALSAAPAKRSAPPKNARPCRAAVSTLSEAIQYWQPQCLCGLCPQSPRHRSFYVRVIEISLISHIRTVSVENCDRYSVKGALKMDVCEPRPRHRGFFLHSDTGESDATEYENPEGFGVRVRMARPSTSRQMASSAAPTGRSRTALSHDEDRRPAIRSGSATGSRQRAHWPR